MIDAMGRDVPVLTDIVSAATQAAQGLDAQAQAQLLAQLPELVQSTVEALRPQFEQALLDALLPRVLALLEQPAALPAQTAVNA